MGNRPQTWLDDVRANPYAEQLAQGFTRLRFAAPLEEQYRAYQLEHSFDLKRISLLAAILIWMAQTLLDLRLVDSPERDAMLVVRVAVSALLLVCGGLILCSRRTNLLVPLTLACILALGIGSAAVVALAHRIDPAYPEEGLLLVCMAGFFLAGLRLSEALACSVVVLVTYIGFELLFGAAVVRLLYVLLYLLFGILIGAVGCYQLEYKSREHFLSRRLLKVMADCDSLTGLHNRRSFRRQFDRVWRQGLREGQPLAMLLCDVDHFKAYNDCYGHQAGDDVLQRIGRLLEERARRPLDMAVRMGGEEFALLLYGSDVDDAREAAEQVRGSLERLGIEHAQSSTAPVVTMSIGVACLNRNDTNVSLKELYARADQLLYEAKNSGRNRIAVSACGQAMLTETTI